MRTSACVRAALRRFARAVSGCRRKPPSASMATIDLGIRRSCGRFCAPAGRARVMPSAASRSRALRAHALHHPAFDHRPRRFPDIEIRIEAARHALHDHHRLLQQHQLRLQPACRSGASCRTIAAAASPSTRRARRGRRSARRWRATPARTSRPDDARGTKLDIVMDSAPRADSRAPETRPAFRP